MFKLNRNYILGLKRILFSVNALIYRELKTKFSKSTLGLLGVFVEPLLGLIVFFPKELMKPMKGKMKKQRKRIQKLCKKLQHCMKN